MDQAGAGSLGLRIKSLGRFRVQTRQLAFKQAPHSVSGQIDLSGVYSKRLRDVADGPILHGRQLKHLILEAADLLLDGLSCRFKEVLFPFSIPNGM
jgi:hypothetical protein